MELDVDHSPAHKNLQVCNLCKIRKKGCDKVLPRCGYCVARSLACEYDRGPSVRATITTPAKWRLWTPSGTTFTESCSSSFQGNGLTNMEPKSHDPVHPRTGLDPGDTIWAHVQQTFDTLNLSVDEVNDVFFEGFHTWLPMLSPRNHRKIANDSADHTPPPGYSLLMLAICLVTFRSFPPSLPTSVADAASLYLTVKATLTQTQAIFPVSTAMIQALILTAAFEYATGICTVHMFRLEELLGCVLWPTLIEQTEP